MVVTILMKNNDMARFSNVTAVSNMSTKIENDMLLIKRKYTGPDWIKTNILIKDIATIEVDE